VSEPNQLRWRLADEDGNGQQALFEEDAPRWRAGHGEFRGLEFLHVNAKRIINEVPAASRMPFRFTINSYRGCSHACTYCLKGDTRILMGDGRTKPLADVEVGDAIYGTLRAGTYRRYAITSVLDKWRTMKPAYRVTLEDGTELVASGDHRFLSDRGWKHVTGAEYGPLQRPHLTLNNQLIGTGGFASSPDVDPAYCQGYLCGMIRGDGHVGSYHYERRGRSQGDVHRFRLALTDLEALHRAKLYLADIGVATRDFVFHQAVGSQKTMHAIRNQSATGVAAVTEAICWIDRPSEAWCKGFLAGIFDAEGSYSQGILRIANTDRAIISRVTSCLRLFGFPFVIEQSDRANGLTCVRLSGGLREHLRFFHTVDPAITRKRSIEGTALKPWYRMPLRVESIEPLGLEMPMYDITTGTGDFIANGVVNHNCFARPTHEYLGLDAGRDFETRIVVKINAVERARAEVAARNWGGHTIAMGTNTDPYQRCEGKYRLTRGLVEVLSEARNPFSILTKSTLILRDLDLLSEAARRTDVRAALSIGTLDEEVWRSSEPGTPHPRRRLEAVARLNEAGVRTGVLVAPILPGLSDAPEQLEAVRKGALEAGAVSVTPIVLHLRPGVREQYMAWLGDRHPDLVATYGQLYRRAYAPKNFQNEVAARFWSAGGTEA
jgi:DNA repair photolyase